MQSEQTNEVAQFHIMFQRDDLFSTFDLSNLTLQLKLKFQVSFLLNVIIVEYIFSSDFHIIVPLYFSTLDLTDFFP